MDDGSLDPPGDDMNVVSGDDSAEDEGGEPVRTAAIPEAATWMGSGHPTEDAFRR